MFLVLTGSEKFAYLLPTLCSPAFDLLFALFNPICIRLLSISILRGVFICGRVLDLKLRQF